MKLAACLKRRRRGAVSVEAAFVLPLVMLVLLGILEYGRYVMLLQVLTNATREGAHYALTHTEAVTLHGVTHGNTTAEVQAIVTKAAGGQKLTGQTIQVYESDVQGNDLGAWTDAAAGESICVRVSGTYNFLIPRLLFLPSTRTVTVQSIMRSEGN